MTKSQNRQRIVQYYRGTARDYHYLMRLPRHWGMHFAFYSSGNENRSEAILNTNRVLAKEAGLKRGMKVFDAGCGVGGSSIWLAKNIGVEAVGMTLVPEEAERATKAAKIEGVSNETNFLAGDYMDTKLRGNYFDVVWGIESICHAENKIVFLREAYRLLKPGGRLVIADGFQRNEKLTKKEEAKMRKWLEGWAVPNLASFLSFENDLKTAGFKRIKIGDKTKNIMPFSKWLYKVGVSVGYPLSKLLQILRLRTEVGTKNVIAAIWQYRTLKKGLWRYGIVSAQK